MVRGDPAAADAAAAAAAGRSPATDDLLDLLDVDNATRVSLPELLRLSNCPAALELVPRDMEQLRAAQLSSVDDWFARCGSSLRSVFIDRDMPVSKEVRLLEATAHADVVAMLINAPPSTQDVGLVSALSQHASSLRALKIRVFSLEQLIRGANPLLEALPAALPLLHTLALRFVGPCQASWLVRATLAHPLANLRVLTMSWSGMMPFAATAGLMTWIAEISASTPLLETLQLGPIALAVDGSRDATDMLARLSPKLIGLSVCVRMYQLAAMVQLLTSLPSQLLHLSLSGSVLSQHLCSVFVQQVLPSLSRLRSLNLSWCFRTASVYEQFLRRGLPCLPDLRHLQVYQLNPSLDVSMQVLSAFAASIPALPLLRRLDLLEYRLGDLTPATTQLLAEGFLARLPMLRSLQLSSWHWHEELVATQILASIRGMDRLRHLAIGTPIPHTCLSFLIADVLPRLSLLRSLDLDSIGLTPSLLPLLLDALAGMPLLEHLDLSCTGYAHAATDVIRASDDELDVSFLPQLCALLAGAQRPRFQRLVLLERYPLWVPEALAFAVPKVLHRVPDQVRASTVLADTQLPSHDLTGARGSIVPSLFELTVDLALTSPELTLVLTESDLVPRDLHPDHLRGTRRVYQCARCRAWRLRIGRSCWRWHPHASRSTDMVGGNVPAVRLLVLLCVACAACSAS